MQLLSALPRGASLTPESWATRHRVLTWVLWGHLPVLVILGLLGPMPSWEALAFPSGTLLLAVAARLVPTTRAQAELTSLGLISTSFVAIELSGGRVDAHLHLFAILVFVALYQQWTPLLYTVGLVVVHHGVLGMLMPGRVFGEGHMAGMADMTLTHTEALVMVAVHAAIVVLEVVGILLLWHFAEEAEAAAATQTRLAEEGRQQMREMDRAALTRASEVEHERVTRLADVAARVSSETAQIGTEARRVAAAIDEIKNQVASLSTAVSEIADRSNEAALTATNGQDAATRAASDVADLQQSMGQIADVNSMIATLAGQTNLLSLNATIEAARAGEMGKGFGVVAGEVKTLATQTTASAAKVSSVLAQVVDQAGTVATSFAATSTSVGGILEIQVSIAAAVEEQSTVLSEVSQQLDGAAHSVHGILDGLLGLEQIAHG